jgi:hypothetical protein
MIQSLWDCPKFRTLVIQSDRSIVLGKSCAKIVFPIGFLNGTMFAEIEMKIFHGAKSDPVGKKPKPLNTIGKLASSFRELHERHQERHRATGFGFAFADRVDYFDPARWDAVAHGHGHGDGGSVFLRRSTLRVIEQHGPENIQPRYAMIFRGDKPVAAMAAQIVSITGDHLKSGAKPDVKAGEKTGRRNRLLELALAPAARVARATVRERVLVAGNLLSWGFDGIAFAADEDPAELWPGVAEALYRIRRAERLGGETNVVMVKDLTPRETGLEALHRFSYRPLETEPNMVLSIDPAWRTYEDYLAALDAKYRRNAKDQVKKLTAAGCVIEPLTDLDGLTDRMHDLYLSVHDNAQVRLVTLRKSYLPSLARALGDDFRCTVARRGDQILGFITSLRGGDTAVGYYIGFDRTAAAEGLPIYLRLLHSTIGDAIGWRCKRLSLGRTALEPKAALGAKPEPMSVWLRHRVPAMNWMIRGMLGAIPHNEAPERNPFKNVAARAEG